MDLIQTNENRTLSDEWQKLAVIPSRNSIFEAPFISFAEMKDFPGFENKLKTVLESLNVPKNVFR
jgi:hypothetical protein